MGLGNPILTDDGVGIHVVRALASRLEAGAPVRRPDLAEASVGGLRLLDRLAGYDRVILVDAIQTAGGKPGDLTLVNVNDLRASLHAGSAHDLTLSGALALGRGLGMKLPADKEIVILAIEAEDVLTFGERCTPAVEAAIPRAVDTVIQLLLAGEGATPSPANSN